MDADAEHGKYPSSVDQSSSIIRAMVVARIYARPLRIPGCALVGRLISVSGD